MSLDIVRSIIKESKNVIFFGGAGTSTESGIPDFRSETGLYHTENKKMVSPEVILSHRFFMTQTEDFYRFYKEKMIYAHAKPNDAHYALAALEKRGILKAVITQNIDGLHQQAGSRNVVELHGSVYRNYCMNCSTSYSLDDVMKSEKVIPVCEKCGGTIRPDVVLYQESLKPGIMEMAISYIQKAEILIIGGTSLMVYPAAGLVDYYHGNKLILMNKEHTPYDRKADFIFHDGIGKVMQYITN